MVDQSALGIESLVGHFEPLTHLLLRSTTVAGVLQQVVEAAVVIVPNAHLASVTVRTADGALHTPVRTLEDAIELDQVQYRTGDGPCVDAADPTGPGYVASDDLSVETRWPQFAAVASGRGYGAIISTELLPAVGQGGLTGALNIYSRDRHGLTVEDRHAAMLLATHGSLALAHARGAELAELRLAQFSRAVETRDVIGQAKGILMGRQGISADEAFALLRRVSQELNIKLVDLAKTLATNHTALDPI